MRVWALWACVVLALTAALWAFAGVVAWYLVTDDGGFS